eukprot:m.189261 g.189261  ORF g.189261 m.189261 type:complete len:302 (-) comp32369_c1_seq2:1069-1974(-)
MPFHKEHTEGGWLSLIQLLSLGVVCGACDLQDSKIFRDVKGWGCESWSGHNCTSQVQFDGVYSAREILAVQINCPVACGYCVTTTVVTTTGTFEVSPDTDDGSITLWGINLIWYFSIPVIAAFIIFLVIFIRKVSYNYRHARLRRQRHRFMQRMADGSYVGSQEALIGLRRRLGLETEEEDECPLPLPTYEESEISRIDDPSLPPNLPPSYTESEATSPTRPVNVIPLSTPPTTASLRRSCSLRPPPPSPRPEQQRQTDTSTTPSPRDVQAEITPPPSPSPSPLSSPPPPPSPSSVAGTLA